MRSVVANVSGPRTWHVRPMTRNQGHQDSHGHHPSPLSGTAIVTLSGSVVTMVTSSTGSRCLGDGPMHHLDRDPIGWRLAM